MGAAAVRSLTLQRIQLFGSAAQLSSYTRQVRPGLRAVPALTRSNINQRFVTARLSSSTNSWKSLSISSVMDSSTNDSIVTRVSMKPSFGSPRANANLVLSKGLASGVSRNSEASTSDSSAHQAEESRYDGSEYSIAN